MADVPSQWQREYKTAVSAGLSSLVSTFVGFPLDSVKTRMQTYKFNSFMDCVLTTKRTEGMTGFFRGIGAPMLSITIVRTLSFSIYTQCRSLYMTGFSKIMGPGYVVDPTGPVALTQEQKQHPGRNLALTLPVYALSGFTAGGFIALFSCPFEFTKLSTQIEMLMARTATASQPDSNPQSEDYRPKGTLQSFKDIIKTRGFLGLYSGFRYHFSRDALGTSIYFTVYESSKQIFRMYNPEAEQTGPVVIAISGALCGIFSWALLFPIDTMKSIVQRDILTRTPGAPLKKRSFNLFNPRMYRGLGVSVARTGLVNMTFFSVYEQLYNKL
ncbi:mitochondrial carrier domain-containing protein [Dipodascopsis uninucleata]